jgi:hypothetical protein
MGGQAGNSSESSNSHSARSWPADLSIIRGWLEALDHRKLERARLTFAGTSDRGAVAEAVGFA